MGRYTFESAPKLPVSKGVGAGVFLEALLEHSADSISVSDRESNRYVVVSDSFCTLTGYVRKDLIGRTSVELGLVADDAARAQMQTRADQSIEGRYETQLRRRDGAIRRVECTVNLVAAELILVISRDVTRRDEAQRELELRAELLDLAHDAVIVREPTGSRVTMWSREAVAVYGYSAAEAAGQITHNLLATVFPESRQAVDEALAREGRWDGVLMHTRKDGRVIAVSSRQAMQRDATGRATEIVELNSDITEQRAAQRELELRAELLDLAHDAVVVREAVENRIIFWNHEAETVYGYTRAEATGQITHDLFETVAPDGVEALDAALAQHGHWEGLLTHRRKDGVVIAISSRQAVRRDAEGRATEIIELNSDITELRQSEETLREANAGLERAGRAKDRFLSSMSHEMRTPLNAILGFTGTLLMGLAGPVTDEQGRQLRTVQRAGTDLLGLINELLYLVQIDSGEMHLHPEAIDCRALLDEVAAGLRAHADQKGLALEVVSSCEWIGLLSDRRTVSQIVINLATNAIKLTDEGSVRLELGQRVEGDRSVTSFAVIDAGCGIAPEHHQHVLAAFEELGTANASPLHGSGLGLYMSQALASLIGGEITFDRAVGHGSRFTLNVPGSAS